jgi:hypothetical protein
MHTEENEQMLAIVNYSNGLIWLYPNPKGRDTNFFSNTTDKIAAE